MRSTTYEVVIEDYVLSRSSGMVIRPQYWLRAARKTRSPDVLAIDLAHRIFYLVEVTSNQNPIQLIDKLEDYRDGELRILGGLKHAFSVSGMWTLRP
jgi:hypothetical protein